MYLDQHSDSDGFRCWLTTEELDQFLALERHSTIQKIAFGLAGRCGLRTKELVDTRPVDVRDGPAGDMVRVTDGKGGKQRSTPIPLDLKASIDAISETRDQPPDEPLIGVSTRGVRKWMETARNTMRADSGDEDWQYVSMHDLRRSWTQHLLDNGVEDGMVMTWGGWERWDTFKDHYKGTYSPKKQQEERSKVAWL